MHGAGDGTQAGARTALTPEERTRFVPPLRDAPIERSAALAAVPANATIAGMYLSPMVEEAWRHRVTLPSARDRYTHFKFFPLREHLQVLFEACEALLPGVSTRYALRKLGRAAPQVLLNSLVGRVMLGDMRDPLVAIEAMAKSYGVNMKPGSGTVSRAGRDHAVVELRDVYSLPDCHHVGVFEGLLRALELPEPRVDVCVLGHSDADLLLQWRTTGLSK